MVQPGLRRSSKNPSFKNINPKTEKPSSKNLLSNNSSSKIDFNNIIIFTLFLHVQKTKYFL